VGKNKILYVSGQIYPYLPESVMSVRGRTLSQAMQEYGGEIRTFMPRWGTINERRNQLHEVIRLSGMNLIIDDNDHQLIIKVASIPAARVQIYFIDNDDYFHRKATLESESGKMFPDNDERAIFFARGVLETVKKLRWEPTIVHCHGWFPAIVPVYLRGSFAEDPVFRGSRIVISLYNEGFGGSLDAALRQKIENEGMQDPKLKILDDPSYENLMKLVIDYADGVVVEETLDDVGLRLVDYAQKAGKPVLDWDGDRQSVQYMDVYHTFYNELLSKS
jgi:starch synthase